jgi:hypothetical protein
MKAPYASSPGHSSSGSARRLKSVDLAAMCNDYANHVPWSVYVEAFSEIKLPVNLPESGAQY